MQEYDVIVIGGGPGGYVAAIRLAQLGKKTAIVESSHLGGVCLNWGCIPTKALLHNAHVINLINQANKFGIEVGDVSVNWGKMIKRSRDVAKRLSKGIEYLIKKNKIDYISGHGKILNNLNVEVTNNGELSTKIKASHIIIATGSKPKWFSGMEPDGMQIITSKEAMVLNKQPESLAIIGAGAIGVEFAHFYNSFGTEITLIEAMPNILPNEDEDISNELEKILIENKINIIKNKKVTKISKNKSNVNIYLDNGDKVNSEKVLIAVGVEPNIEKLFHSKSDILFNKGWIQVNQYMQTSIENIYAIGDVAGPPWLAHVASAEGITAAEHICNLNPEPMEYHNIPGCTYCYPEVASVGFTEKEAIDKGYDIKIGKFPFKALGKSVATGDVEGFVKVVYDSKYGEMLGCHILGSEATNLISEAVISRNLEAVHYSILKTIHPHPTLSEALLEATADAMGEAIHI